MSECHGLSRHKMNFNSGPSDDSHAQDESEQEEAVMDIEGEGDSGSSGDSDEDSDDSDLSDLPEVSATHGSLSFVSAVQ